MQDRRGPRITWFTLLGVFRLDDLYSDFHQGRSSQASSQLYTYHNYRARWVPPRGSGQSVRTVHTPQGSTNRDIGLGLLYYGQNYLIYPSAFPPGSRTGMFLVHDA